MHEPTTPETRRLVVIRHALAEQAEASDLERRLTPQGESDALEAGRWLAAQGVMAEAALVSAARRAVGTWEAVARGAGWSVPPVVDRGLYTADPDTALDLVRATDDVATTLVLVGHNPTVETLAQLLDGGDGDPAAGLEMMRGFSPGTAAVFELDGSWAELGWAGARVQAYRPGRR